jgi:hypothetical protein
MTATVARNHTGKTERKDKKGREGQEGQGREGTFVGEDAFPVEFVWVTVVVVRLPWLPRAPVVEFIR